MSKTTSGNSKKIGRNGAMCKVYRDRNVRMRNKIRKVKRHLKAIAEKQERRPIRADWQAQDWFDAA